MELDLMSTGLKTLAMLSLVVGLLLLCLFGVRRFLLFRKGGRGDSLIRRCSSLYLSAKERIEVLEIAGERIVVGITPGRISFLTKLEGSEREEKRFDET